MRRGVDAALLAGAFLVLWTYFGPIAVILPIVFLPDNGNTDFPFGVTKLIWFVLGCSYSLFTFLYLVLGGNLVVLGSLMSYADLRLLDTSASASIVEAGNALIFSYFFELASAFCATVIVLFFKFHRGAFSRWFDAALREAVDFQITSATKIGWLAFFGFISSALIPYLFGDADFRQYAATLLFPASPIIQILSGSVLVFIAQGKHRGRFNGR